MPAPTTSVNCRCADVPAASRTCSVKTDVAAAAGVPLSNPFGDRIRPAGSVPPASDHV